MNKSIRFAILLILCCQITNAQPKLSILIKYSTHDCAVCNVPFSRIFQLPKGMEKTIVFSDAVFGETEIDYPLELANENGFNIVYSDSLQQVYDSTPRSMLFVLRDKRIVYRNAMKDVDFKLLSDQIIEKFGEELQSSAQPAAKYFPSVTRKKADPYRTIRLTDKHLYIFYWKGYIVQIDKTRLEGPFDTIYLNTPEMTEQVFRAKYPGKYKQKLGQYHAYCRSNNLPFLSPSFSGINITNDTITVTGSFSNIETDNIDSSINKEGGIKIDRDFAILTLVEGKVVKTRTASYLPDSSGFFISTECFRKAGEFFMSVRKENTEPPHFLFARTKLVHQRYEIDQYLPILLPAVNIRTGMGYSMISDFDIRDSFLQLMYDNKLYKLSNFQTYTLPFYLELYKNKVGKLDFYTLNSHVADFNYSGNDFYFTYRSNDSMYYAHCLMTETALALQKVSYICSLQHAHELLADKKGIFLFNKEAGDRIDYIPY